MLKTQQLLSQLLHGSAGPPLQDGPAEKSLELVSAHGAHGFHVPGPRGRQSPKPPLQQAAAVTPRPNLPGFITACFQPRPECPCPQRAPRLCDRALRPEVTTEAQGSPALTLWLCLPGQVAWPLCARDPTSGKQEEASSIAAGPEGDDQLGPHQDVTRGRARQGWWPLAQ